MPFKRSAMRYGHIVGYTSAVYQENGERIISFGYDGDIRVWDGVFDDDASTTCLAENVWALMQYGDRVLVANDLNTVQAYKYPELEKDGIEFRFTAFVTSLARNGQYLAAGSEDGTIKVKTTGKDGDEFELEGLSGPVLSMALSPKNLLAASSGDGKLRVWDLESKKLVKTLDGLRKVKSFEGNVYFATPSFDPKRGAVLAYPRGKEIVVLNTTTWDQQKLLKHKSVSSEFTCGAFCPRGEFFAAGSAKGEVVIWDYKTGELVKGEEVSIDSNPLISLTWHPKNNGELVICDDQGQLGNVHDIFIDTDDADVGNDLMEMAEKEANGVAEEDDDDLDEIYSKHVAGTKQVAEESGDSEDSQEDENCISVNKLKSQFALPNEDEDQELEDGKPEDYKSEDGIPEHEQPQVKAASPHVDYDDDEDARSVMSDSSVRSYPMQRYFQPGSTPEKLAHRYLVYNHVGIVRGHTDDKDKSIEVEFHDSSKHHGMHLANFHNHTVAGLSETVVAMAGPIGPDSNSKLVCINLVAFGNREWSSTMTETEEIIGVVASDKIVVTATNARLLRVYSAKGTRREVLAIPGPPVSMAAYGDHILVAYHRSSATRDQHLNLMIITCVNYRLRCREVPIPLTPESELRWLGYSDKGSPVIFDSAGSMRLYNAASNLWFPILDAEKHKIGASDSLFIVTVSESRQQAQIIVCRGAKFPQTNPRPIPLNVPIKVPLCEIESDKSILEGSLLQSMYLKHDDADKVMKEAAVKLFALACRAEMEPRAKELIETIASSQLIPLVCKYARKINRVHLAESLSALQGTFLDQEKEEEQFEMEVARENAAMVSELVHINQEAVTKKDNTPKIKPIPVTMRKNPFKKSGSSALCSPATPNPLEHLTSSAIGFPSPTVSNRLTSKNGHHADTDSPAASMTVENNGNDPTSNGTSGRTPTTPAAPSGPGKFTPWFEKNKAQLREDHPTVEETELIKIGLRQFKTLNSYLTPQTSNGNGEKRKRDDGEQAESGVSKLAKFGFVKKG